MFRAAEGIEVGNVPSTMSRRLFFPVRRLKAERAGVQVVRVRHGRVSAVEHIRIEFERVTEGARLIGRPSLSRSRSFASTDPEPLALLRRAHLTVAELEHSSPSTDALAALLADADGPIIGAIPLTATHFAAAPRLRVVAMHGVGVDHIDLDAASARRRYRDECAGKQ